MEESRARRRLSDIARGQGDLQVVWTIYPIWSGWTESVERVNDLPYFLSTMIASIDSVLQPILTGVIFKGAPIVRLIDWCLIDIFRDQPIRVTLTSSTDLICLRKRLKVSHDQPCAALRWVRADWQARPPGGVWTCLHDNSHLVHVQASMSAVWKEAPRFLFVFDCKVVFVLKCLSGYHVVCWRASWFSERISERER